MSSRDIVLGRVRDALKDQPAPVEVAWEYGRPDTTVEDVVALFCERVEDYRAVVERAGADEVPARVAAALQAAGATSVVVPDGLDDAWRDAVASVAQVVTDAPPLTAAQLDEVGAVVTGAAVGIAVTGTIVLDHGPGQGRRALSLVPDVHVCVVRSDQVVSDVPEGVTRLADAAAARRPMTWISGPSATSDIELQRVEGVHGPRTLHVIVVD